MNILIAEDNLPVRRMIRSLVEKPGDKIYECADGVEAVAAYVKHQPDWILLDIEMPKMDGIAATRAIHDINPQAKIIVVTSYDDPGLRVAAAEAGAAAYVVKDDLSRLRVIISGQTDALNCH